MILSQAWNKEQTITNPKRQRRGKRAGSQPRARITASRPCDIRSDGAEAGGRNLTTTWQVLTDEALCFPLLWKQNKVHYEGATQAPQPLRQKRLPVIFLSIVIIIIIIVPLLRLQRAAASEKNTQQFMPPDAKYTETSVPDSDSTSQLSPNTPLGVNPT